MVRYFAEPAILEESFMRPDTNDGTPREFDILIRIPTGHRELTVAVECRDHKRRADVPWIDQLHGRYLTLPIQDRRGLPKGLQQGRNF